MQNYPLNQCVYMFFHWETPGNHRFDLFIKRIHNTNTQMIEQSPHVHLHLGVIEGCRFEPRNRHTSFILIVFWYQL